MVDWGLGSWSMVAERVGAATAEVKFMLVWMGFGLDGGRADA